jgi:hypothetical protein
VKPPEPGSARYGGIVYMDLFRNSCRPLPDRSSRRGVGVAVALFLHLAAMIIIQSLL